MMNFDIKKSFRNKNFKYGGYATAVTAVVLAILLIVNLVAGRLDLKFDLTKDKMFSLSETTNKILADLKSDVKVYALYQSGNENLSVREILDKYKSGSRRISVEYKDPVLYPQFANKYSTNNQEVGTGYVIVESGSKFKTISEYDMVNYNYSDPSNPQAESLAIEQRLTSAIMYVTSEENPVINVLEGHNEAAVSPELQQVFDNQNYTTKSLSLLTGDTKLELESTLLVIAPKKDISNDETTKIKDFLAKGGRAIFLMDITNTEMPNFNSVLAAYGLGLQKAIVVEGDQQHSAQLPIYLLPDMQSHEIVSPLISNNFPVVIPVAQGIELLKLKKQSTTIETFLTTTKDSWGKTNLDATTFEKETGDIGGPFNLAVAVTDKIDPADPDKVAKLVVIGSANFTNSQFISLSNGANSDLVMNSINWLQDKEDSITVSPKSLTSEYLTINTLQQLVYSGVVVILIPLGIMIAGLVVWSRRKHR